MKTKLITLGIVVMSFITSFAQSTNFVGKWESTTQLTFNNNSILKIKISGTEHPNYLIITREESPKKKIGAKYDETTNRLYTTVKGTQIYFVYDNTTDTIEAFKINDASICDFIRF